MDMTHRKKCDFTQKQYFHSQIINYIYEKQTKEINAFGEKEEKKKRSTHINIQVQSVVSLKFLCEQ